MKLLFDENLSFRLVVHYLKEELPKGLNAAVKQIANQSDPRRAQ